MLIEDSSSDRNVQRAFREAKRLRKAHREEAVIKATSGPFVFRRQ
jgi:uncharacterized protein (UPF0147 family)